MALDAGDMEDGQLSDSDSDMMVAPSDRPLPVPKVLVGGSAARGLQSPTAAGAPASHYRTVKSVDSSEESFSDSDDESSLWKRKRQKCLSLPPKPEPFQFDQSSQKPPPPEERRLTTSGAPCCRSRTRTPWPLNWASWEWRARLTEAGSQRPTITCWLRNSGGNLRSTQKM